MPTEIEIKDGVTPNTETDDQADETPAGLTDAAKEILRKNRETARNAEKARKDAERERDELRLKVSDAETKRLKDEEDAAAKRGEFQKLAEDRKTALDAATAEQRTLSERVKAYEDRDRARIEDAIKADRIDKRDLSYDPGPAAPIEQRITWFEKAMAQSEGTGANPIQRTPNSPRPAERTREQVIETEKAQLRRKYGVH